MSKYACLRYWYTNADQNVKLGAILNPTIPVDAKLADVFCVVFALAPWLAELVLASRLLVVYPLHSTPKLKLAAVKVQTTAALVYLTNEYLRDQAGLEAGEYGEFLYARKQWESGK